MFIISLKAGTFSVQLLSHKAREKQECDRQSHLMATFCCACPGHALAGWVGTWLADVQRAASGCNERIPAESHTKRNVKWPLSYKPAAVSWWCYPSAFHTIPAFCRGSRLNGFGVIDLRFLLGTWLLKPTTFAQELRAKEGFKNGPMWRAGSGRWNRTSGGKRSAWFCTSGWKMSWSSSNVDMKTVMRTS